MQIVHSPLGRAALLAGLGLALAGCGAGSMSTGCLVNQDCPAGQICAAHTCVDRPPDLAMKRDAGGLDMSAVADGGAPMPDLSAQAPADLAGMGDRDGAVDLAGQPPVDLAGADLVMQARDLAGVDEGAADLAMRAMPDLTMQAMPDLAGQPPADLAGQVLDLAEVDAAGADLAQVPDLAEARDIASPPDLVTPIDFGAAKKRVFVTSQIYPATLGGLSGADAACQARANAANLGGTWKAWLSDAKTSASDRLTHWSGIYTLVDGTAVAFGWTQLVSGTLLHGIDKTETGGAPPAGTTSCFGGNKPTVWTATTTAGVLLAGSCTSWTAIAADAVIAWGSPSSANASWTQYCTSGMADNCKSSSALYCFEQ